MFWSSSLKYLISVTGITALLAFLGRALITQLLAKDLQKFQSDLQHRNNLEIERLRSDLKAMSFERETAFASLHERRAKILSRLYMLLARAEEAFQILTSPLQITSQEQGQKQEKERRQKASDNARNLRRYYDENRLYLDEFLCKLMEEFQDQLWEAWVNFTSPNEHHQKQFDAWNTIKGKLPSIRSNIEKTIREMLGIRNSSKQLENMEGSI
jgi:hypothetical protein